MGLNMKTPRQAVKVYFANDGIRDSVLKTVGSCYPDVLMQKGCGGAILVSLTDSNFYDSRVMDDLRNAGGQVLPR